MRIIVMTAILATGLGGCQTMEQSRANADDVCLQSGLRPATRSFRNCVSVNMRQDRRQSDAAAGAVVAGATAGILGAALVAESRSSWYDESGYYGRSYYGDPGYGGGYYYRQPRYYRGCGAWGC